MKKALILAIVFYPFFQISAQRLIVKPSSRSNAESHTPFDPERRFALKTSLTSVLVGQFAVSGEYVLNNSLSAELELGLLGQNFMHELDIFDFAYARDLDECFICTEEKNTLGFSYAAHLRYFWDYAAFEDVGYFGLLISRRNYRGKYSISDEILSSQPGSGIQVVGYEEKREENYTDIAFSLGHQSDYSDVVFLDYNILLGFRMVESKGLIENVLYPYGGGNYDDGFEFGTVNRQNVMFQIQVKLGFILF